MLKLITSITQGFRLILFSSFLVFVSLQCRKQEFSLELADRQITEQFFRLPGNASPELTALANDIERQNAQYHFIPAFTKKNGTPVWKEVFSNVPVLKISDISESTITHNTRVGNQHPLFFIPLKAKDGTISSYIVSLKTDSTYKYKFYSKSRLENAILVAPNKDSALNRLIELQVIGYFEQKINKKDSVFLASSYYSRNSLTIKSKNTGQILSLAASNTSGYWDTQIVTVCFRGASTVQQRNAEDDIHIISSHGAPQTCYDKVEYVWVSGEGGGSGGGGGGGGSTGGGTGGGTNCPALEWWCDAGLANAQVIDKLANLGNLNIEQQTWLVNNSTISNELYMMLDEAGYFNGSIPNTEFGTAAIALNIMLDITRNNLTRSSFNTSIKNILDAYLDPSLTASPDFDPVYWRMVGVQMAFLKVEHPEWSYLRCFWEANSMMAHISLDIAGLIPGFGEAADLANGVIYSIEGNGLDAKLSFASAIPLAGWGATGAKIARYTLKFTDNSTTVLNYIRKGNGFVDFGKKNSTQFRKILGLPLGDVRQAHHLIPWEIADDAVVQAAALSKEAFHLQKALNGIPLSTIQHMGSHPNYTARVKTALTNILNSYGGTISPSDASQKLQELITKIRTAIINNPNTKIDDIIF
jgi:hypothetical protein